MGRSRGSAPATPPAPTEGTHPPPALSLQTVTAHAPFPAPPLLTDSDPQAPTSQAEASHPGSGCSSASLPVVHRGCPSSHRSCPGPVLSHPYPWDAQAPPCSSLWPVPQGPPLSCESRGPHCRRRGVSAQGHTGAQAEGARSLPGMGSADRQTESGGEVAGARCAVLGWGEAAGARTVGWRSGRTWGQAESWRGGGCSDRPVSHARPT